MSKIDEIRAEMVKDMKGKDKEKLEVLSSSNYSNKEKQTLYENYILSDTDKKYLCKGFRLNISLNKLL